MERHFTYFQNMFPGELGIDAEKFVFATLIAATLFILGKASAAKLSTADGIQSKLIPQKKFRLFDFFDVFNEMFISFHDSVLGKRARRYYPMSASIFLFLLVANLAGLIPGMPASTTTVWVNVSLALIAFIAFNYYGVGENGILNYSKHMAGGSGLLRLKLLIPIAVFLFLLETFSFVLRIVTLNLRLYWNILADHIIISTIGELTSGWFVIFGPVLLAKGLLVSVLQAAVFTVLTMVYILLATQHDEEH